MQKGAPRYYRITTAYFCDLSLSLISEIHNDKLEARRVIFISNLGHINMLDVLAPSRWYGTSLHYHSLCEMLSLK
jgi:hypothetical protein